MNWKFDFSPETSDMIAVVDGDESVLLLDRKCSVAQRLAICEEAEWDCKVR